MATSTGRRYIQHVSNNERTTCLVVGGGPAGMVLGLLLARAGVPVTVLEKHADFLRDFRGDTVHASTLTLLDELGLGARFAALPQRRLDRATVQLDERARSSSATSAGCRARTSTSRWCRSGTCSTCSRTPARRSPTFTLRRNAEVTDLLREGGRVVGARFTDRTDGSVHELRAVLTVACDGRGSAVRAAGRAAAAGLRRADGRVVVPAAAARRRPGGRRRAGRQRRVHGDDRPWRLLAVRLPIRKGSDAGCAPRGSTGSGPGLTALQPWIADRVDALASFDDVKLLDVRLDRLRRWYADGLLLIGDAAHAM